MRETFIQIMGILLALVVRTEAGAQTAAGVATTADLTSLCRILTQAEVSRALHVVIVRAEAPATDLPGCEFSIKGTFAEAGAGHSTELAKSAALAHGTQLDDSTQKLLDTFAKGIFQGSDSEKSAAASARHPGEVPVLTFDVRISADAKAETRATRQTEAGISLKGVSTVVGLGDEAFDSGGAMLTVRKGDKLLQVRYPLCACTTQDVVPLARKIVASL